MDIKEIFGDIEINEEQAAALVSFVNERAEARCSAVTEEFEKYKKQAKRAFAMHEADSKKERAAFEGKARKAFAMLEADCKKAFELGVTDAKRMYAENMVTAMQEMYSETYKKARGDLLASPEFAVVEELRRKMAGEISPETKAALEELDQYKRRASKAEEDKAKLERENTINSLCEDVPEKYRERVRKFVSRGKTADEAIEFFNAIAEAILSDESGGEGEPESVSEELTAAPFGADKNKISARARFSKKNAQAPRIPAKDNIAETTPVFESETTPSVNQDDKGTKERFSRGFTDFESRVLSTFVFPQRPKLNK